MSTDTNPNATTGRLVHVVTLACKDDVSAKACLGALADYGRPDAMEFGCRSYEFGLQAGTSDTVYLVERWDRWDDLDALLGAKVVPALPMYDQLLARPFDPAQDTVRIELG